MRRRLARWLALGACIGAYLAFLPLLERYYALNPFEGRASSFLLQYAPPVRTDSRVLAWADRVELRGRGSPKLCLLRGAVARLRAAVSRDRSRRPVVLRMIAPILPPPAGGRLRELSLLEHFTADDMTRVAIGAVADRLMIFEAFSAAATDVPWGGQKVRTLFLHPRAWRVEAVAPGFRVLRRTEERVSCGGQVYTLDLTEAVGR